MRKKKKSIYKCGGKLPKKQAGGALDYTLEGLGNILSVTDPLGLGYGQAIERGLGNAIGEDEYVKGLDQGFDILSSFSQGAVRGAANALPGGSLITGAVDQLGNTTNRAFGNEGQDPLYANQEKLQDISTGAGKIGGATAAGILTGNVGGAFSSGAGGASDILSATGNTQAAQTVDTFAPILGMAAGAGSGGGLNNLEKMEQFSSSGFGTGLGNMAQVAQYSQPLLSTINSTQPPQQTVSPLFTGAPVTRTPAQNSWASMGYSMKNGGS
jgi:hypothetical protein